MDEPTGQPDEERPFSEAPHSEIGFLLPVWLRVLGGFVLAAMLVASLILIGVYVWYEKTHLEPAKLDIIELVIFCLLGLAIFLLPWQKYRMRIRKIGPVEFEEVMSNQAREHAVNWHELRQRIEGLEVGLAKEKTAAGTKSVLDSSSRKDTHELQSLLKNFLTVQRPTAFSPVRIASWGAHQPGFENLGKHGQDEIRRALHALVVDGSLETTISRKGNTLYRLVR